MNIYVGNLPFEVDDEELLVLGSNDVLAKIS